MSLLDALVPSRHRALEAELAAESAARVAAEHELARTQKALRQVREERDHARAQIRGMARDLDEAQEAEERLTEELFEARDEAAAWHGRMVSKGRVNAELSQRLREVLHERDQLRIERPELLRAANRATLAQVHAELAGETR